MLLTFLALMAVASPAASPPPPPDVVELFEKTVTTKVDIDLEFDDAGKPRACRVRDTSASPQTDAQLCADILSGKVPLSPPSKAGASPAADEGDPERTARLLNIGEVFTQDDYPAEAIRRGEQGRTIVSVSIDASGRPTQCAISQSSGSSSLDRASCARLVARGRFEIGRDASGRPAGRVAPIAVKWVLPDETGAPFAEGGVRTVFKLDRDAQVTSCRFEGVSGEITTSENCDFLRPVAAKIVEVNFEKGIAANRELVLENGMLLGAPEGVRVVGGGPGMNLVRRAAWALTINADGTVVDCKVFEVIDANEEVGARKCAEVKKQVFEPLPPEQADRSPRFAVAYIAVYLRP